MTRGRVTLSFEDRGPVEAADLAHFLFLFRGAYAAALAFVPRVNIHQFAKNSEIIELRLKSRLRTLNVSSVDKLFSKRLGKRSPTAERIVRESPLEIVIAGVLIALALAVILSGGKIKLDIKSGKIEADLQPIGEGIQRLRDALAKSPKAPLGYGVKAKQIRLSSQEYDELMKYDPASEKRGGFQRLLIGMQYRTNRRTQELTLSDYEMDFILRHGRNPDKGGWQKSIKIIFGRHFDLV